MLQRCLSVLFLCFFSVFCLLSCGLEAFYYIDYIPPGDYTDTTRATIWLPSSSTEGYNYFDHFMIFYRIYISDSNPVARIDTPELRSSINSTLNSDYNGLYSYTDITSTTVNTSNLDSTFNNRKYFKLELDDRDINRVLSGNSLGKTLEIAFPPNNGVKPTLELDGDSYSLYRAVLGTGLNFTPKPDRYFLNHPDLRNSANATNEINADVATNSNVDSEHTYVSMYIAAVGTTLEMPPRTIYSQPTFIGIFKLANSI